MNLSSSGDAEVGDAVGDGGVEHGRRLIAFVEAVMGDDDAALQREREALKALLSPQAFIEAASTVGAFNVVDRIANATGIPLDPMLEAMSSDFREELELTSFVSAANTPGAV